jgi:hypothetical protein
MPHSTGARVAFYRPRALAVSFLFKSGRRGHCRRGRACGGIRGRLCGLIGVSRVPPRTCQTRNERHFNFRDGCVPVLCPRLTVGHMAVEFFQQEPAQAGVDCTPPCSPWHTAASMPLPPLQASDDDDVTLAARPTRSSTGTLSTSSSRCSCRPHPGLVSTHGVRCLFCQRTLSTMLSGSLTTRPSVHSRRPAHAGRPRVLPRQRAAERAAHG